MATPGLRPCRAPAACPRARSEVSPWNYLAVELRRTSSDVRGDPDVFGLWTGGPRGPEMVPNRTTQGWDFSDTSAASAAVTSHAVARRAFGDGAGYTGALLCVRAYGGVGVGFSLRALRDLCPLAFDPADGQPLVCSTKRGDPNQRHDECTAEGACQCLGSFARPVPDVFPGEAAGFCCCCCCRRCRCCLCCRCFVVIDVVVVVAVVVVAVVCGHARTWALLTPLHRSPPAPECRLGL